MSDVEPTREIEPLTLPEWNMLRTLIDAAFSMDLRLRDSEHPMVLRTLNTKVQMAKSNTPADLDWLA